MVKKLVIRIELRKLIASDLKKNMSRGISLSTLRFLKKPDEF